MIKKYIFFASTFFLFNNLCEANYDFSIIKGIPSNFQANSPNATAFEWTFPEGIKKSGQSVFHTFQTIGEKNVLLEVTNGTETNSLTKVIYVRNLEKPTAIINVIIDGKINTTGTVYSNTTQTKEIKSLSVNEEGTTENLTINWSLNGQNSSINEITNAIKNEGTYDIKLITSNKKDSSLKDEVSISLIVENAPPIIKSINFEKDSKLGAQKVTVSVNAEDPDGSIEQYRFEVLEFNKTIFAQISTTPEAIFNLAQFPGTHNYNFKAEVTDNSKQKTKKVSTQSLNTENNTENNAPIVNINISPSNMGDTQTVFSFFGNGTDQDKDALTYEWTFPDGEKKIGKNTTKTFSKTGNHTITLSADDGIDKIEKTINITISESQNSTTDNSNSTNEPVNIKIKSILPSQKGNTETIFSFYSEITGNNENLTFSWNMGDDAKYSKKDIIHKFTETGTYNVSVLVFDGKKTSTDTTTITIKENTETNKKELQAILTQTKTEKETLLATETNPTKQKQLQEEINEIDNQIKNNNTTQQNTETNKKELQAILTQTKTEKETLLATETNPIKQKQLQEEINEIDNQIKNTQQTTQNNTNNDPFSNSLQTILTQTKTAKEALLATETNSTKQKQLQDEITTLDNQIKKIQENPFQLETESIEGQMELLEKQKTEKIQEFKNEKNPEKRRLIQEEIIEIEDKIETFEFIYPSMNSIAIENEITKLNQTKELTTKLIEKETDPIKKLKLTNDLKETESKLALLENSQESTGDSLEKLKEQQNILVELKKEKELLLKTETDPIKKQILKNELKTIEEEIQKNKDATEIITSTPLIEIQLKKIRDEKIKQIANETDPQKKALLEKELETINQEIKNLKENPFSIKNEITKTNLELLKNKKIEELKNETDPEKRELLKNEINQIDKQLKIIEESIKNNPEENTLPIDIFSNINTKIFLYGKVQKYTENPLFFEWDLGNGNKKIGQNITIQYEQTGIYKAQLTVSNGNEILKQNYLILKIE